MKKHSLRGVNATSAYILLQATAWSFYAIIMSFSSNVLRDFGFSDSRISLVLGLSTVGSFALQLILAELISRFRRWKVYGVMLILGSALLLINLSMGRLPKSAAIGAFSAAIMLLQLLPPFANAMGMDAIENGSPTNYSLARGMGSLAYSFSAYLTGMLVRKNGTGMVPLIASVCAILFLAATGWYHLAEELLAPMTGLLTAVPVASFAVLLLIWRGPSFLAAAISFLIVFPAIYTATLQGIRSVDGKLLEMAKVFGMPLWNRLFYLYRPGVRPFLVSSLKVAVGMSWKSGVAAEVIGMTEFSIGGQLYLSKVYMDTVGVFAWTVTVICLSVVFERLLLALTNVFFAWQPACRAAKNTSRQCRDAGADERKRDAAPGEKPQEAAILKDVLKTYDGKVVLDHLSAVYHKGMTYYLTGPSGSGKTTLLRLLAGLEESDAGEVQCFGEISFLFQEDRLCPDYSAVKNVELVTGDPDRARSALAEVLEAEDLDKPCSALSGGMKRRVALVRALEKESDIVLLDEPFTGMDEQTKERVTDYMERRKEGRTFLIATHN